MFNYRLSDVIEYYGFVVAFTALGRWGYVMQVAEMQNQSLWIQISLLTLSDLQWIILASIIIAASTINFAYFLFSILIYFFKK